MSKHKRIQPGLRPALKNWRVKPGAVDWDIRNRRSFHLNTTLISIIGGGVGAVIGTIWAGVGGATAGALLASLVPVVVDSLTTQSRLKRRILKTLSAHGQMEVRDIMKAHGLDVPTDCFSYEQNNNFVRNIVSYKAALQELEVAHKIIHNSKASVGHGYVDPPNDWINEWAGRAYSHL